MDQCKRARQLSDNIQIRGGIAKSLRPWLVSEPNIFIEGLFKRELVKVIQLDVLHNQQPHPRLHYRNNRF